MREVLAIGAHPDDIELGCGATLLAHAAVTFAPTRVVLDLAPARTVPAPRSAVEEHLALLSSLPRPDSAVRVPMAP